MASDTIWNWQSSRSNCMFRIVQEVSILRTAFPTLKIALPISLGVKITKIHPLLKASAYNAHVCNLNLNLHQHPCMHIFIAHLHKADVGRFEIFDNSKSNLVCVSAESF
jgi:hypothetical protein